MINIKPSSVLEIIQLAPERYHVHVRHYLGYITWYNKRNRHDAIQVTSFLQCSILIYIRMFK